MGKALVVVSFGTSFEAVLTENIAPVEKRLASAFPTHDFYRAFTSRFIVKKLQARGMEIAIEKDLVSRLLTEGYDEIFIQPTHVIPGFEYEEKILTLKALSPVITIGRPLLMVDEDYRRLGNVLNEVYKLDQLDAPFVFMGHGTEHAANDHYVALGKYLQNKYPQVYLAGVEGDCDFETVLEAIKETSASSIEMAPLMLVAGDHARNDMAGDEADSWKSLAEAAGYKVKIHLKGLGAMVGVQEMIVENAQAT